MTRIARDARWLGLIALALGLNLGEAARAGDGKRVNAVDAYRTSCLKCHEHDGRGESTRGSLPRIPDFTDVQWQASRTDIDLTRAITEGKGRSMPRLKQNLKADELTKLVAVVRGFQGGKTVIDDVAEPPTTPPPSDRSPLESARGRSTTPRIGRSSSAGIASDDRSQGARIYQQLCVKCHGANGRGAEAREDFPEIPDFTSAEWRRKRGDTQLRVSILEGRGTGMPSFRGKIDKQQARLIVAYLGRFSSASSTTPVGSTNDFEGRFQRLAEEVEELGRQVRELADKPGKP